MRPFLGLLAFVIFSACSFVESFQNRDVGFLYWGTDEDVSRLFVRKVGIIRGRNGSPVQYEASNEDFLIEGLSFFADRPRDIAVKADGQEVYVWLEGAPTAGASAVQVFNVANSRRRFQTDADAASRDAVLTCDLTEATRATVAEILGRVGISPADVTGIEFSARPAIESLPEFEPLGWASDDRLVVRLNARFGLLVRTADQNLNIGADAGDLFLSYNLSSSIPTCDAQPPLVQENQRAFADSTIISELGRAPRLAIEGQVVALFPASPPEAPQSFPIPGRSARFFGPFRQ